MNNKRIIKKNTPHHNWQIQEAKAKFSQLVNETKIGYQTITKNGEPVAVIMSQEDFDNLLQPKSTFINFFKSAPYPEVELENKRRKDLPREIVL